jgi:hypothetical protein
MGLSEASKILESTAKVFEKFYLCIDALDECNESQRRLFLQCIAAPVDNNSVRVFFTGRLYIEEVLPKSIRCTIQTIYLEANPEDIRRYVSRQLELDPNHDDMDDEFKNEIMYRIVETADRM